MLDLPMFAGEREARVQPHTPSRRTLRGLDVLNFFLADVQTGVGPFLAIYLAGRAWDAERVGLALTVGAVAGIVAQTPAGALVDATRWKRGLVAVALIAVGVAALLVAWAPRFWPIMIAQSVIGIASSIFIPVLCAMSLGVVGRARFDARQGRNQTLNAAGNVSAALSMGALGYYLSDRSVFFAVALLTIPTMLSLFLIRPEEIDHAAARGATTGSTSDTKEPAQSIFDDRLLVIFLVCAVLFHFANAAMLPLLGQRLAQGQGHSSMLFMSACVVTTQVVITCLSSWVGKQAGRRGRRPLLLVAFSVLPVRGLLYTITAKTSWLVAIQLLDGVGAGIFNVVSVLVIADLTRGSGRFNVTVGAITTAAGLGAALSQLIAGAIVHRAGFNAGLTFLSAVAALALGTLYFFLPETLRIDQPVARLGRATSA